MKYKFDKGLYRPMEIRETERLIKFVKDRFERSLAGKLNLERVSAPIIVTEKSGINDYLSGGERPVGFDLRDGGERVEVVQSLAKWKRMALKEYGFAAGEGLYTDMTALRANEDMDELHSVYVDQWDWEKVIEPRERTLDFLKDTVGQIAGAIGETSKKVAARTDVPLPEITDDVAFALSGDLEKMYPDMTPKQREYEFTKKKKTAFIMQIGGRLPSGGVHDARAADYDDWGLNGDLFYYHPVLDCAMEISSMGIRVDAASLEKQMTAAGQTERMKHDYHRQIMAGELPLTIGGGIGQSRLCMLLLGRAHVGEVQSSVWKKEIKDDCAEHDIKLL